jgi:hypothetical protein
MMWKASSRRKLKGLLQRRSWKHKKQNGETDVDSTVNGQVGHHGLPVPVCSSSSWSDADDSFLSFGDLDRPDTNSTGCESICSVNEFEHEFEHEHEHDEFEHGNNTLHSTNSSTQSISVTCPELVAQVSRLEALLSNQNMELNHSSCCKNSDNDNDNDSDHDSHSYYGSENEDDSLANELEQLTKSEEALRNELEQYQSYSQVSSISMQDDHTGSDGNTESELLETAQDESECSEQPISESISTLLPALLIQQLQQPQPQPLPLHFASRTMPNAVLKSSPDGTQSGITCGNLGPPQDLSLLSYQCHGQVQGQYQHQYQYQHSNLPSCSTQELVSSLCRAKQEPFQSDGNAATTITTMQDSAVDGHDEPCCSESSDSDSMLYSLLQEEDLPTIPEQTPLYLPSATQRVAVKGGWDWAWETMPLKSDDSVASDVDVDGDNGNGNDNDNDYLDDSCLSDQQVDETEKAESLQNGGCVALAQAAVPAKRVALLGGGEWEMMRKEDLSLLLADDSDSSSDQLDNMEIEQDTALVQPVPAKRVAILGGGEWETIRDGDFFLHDDSNSSSDQLDNESENSTVCMFVTAAAEPLPAKRAAVLGGGHWKKSLEDDWTDDLTDDSDWSSSSDPLNEEADGVLEAILPLAGAKGRSDDVAAVIKTEHQQWSHSRIVSCFVIAFITITILSKAYISVVEVTLVSKAQPPDEIDVLS